MSTKVSRPSIFVIWPLLLVAENLQTFFPLRPQLLSFALCAILLVLLDRAFCDWQTSQRVHWRMLGALSLVFLVWANAHGGFVLGLGILGAYLGGRIVEAFLHGRAAAWPRILALSGYYFTAIMLQSCGDIAIATMTPRTPIVCRRQRAYSMRIHAKGPCSGLHCQVTRALPGVWRGHKKSLPGLSGKPLVAEKSCWTNKFWDVQQIKTTWEFEMTTLLDTKKPSISPSQPPLAPTVDPAFFKRLEATIVAAEEAVSVGMEIGSAPTQGEQTQTALAVSVVIPVYNERDTIAEIVRRVQAVGIHQEIVIVDDYSLDGTREILLELAQQPDIRVLMHGYNRGKGAALRTAFAEVAGDVVVIQDADLEYDPKDFRQLLAPIERGEAEVVYGSRFLKNASQDPSRLHRVGNWLLTALSNRLTGQRLTDMETCYKAFRREILQTIDLQQNRFGFEPEITAKLSRLGKQIVEVPIGYDYRGYDEGKKIGIQDGLNAIWCIVRYAF